MNHLVKAFPCQIECIQADNGKELTNRFTSHNDIPTFIKNRLEAHNIQHKIIRPYTPRHSGKIERSYRKDNGWFYSTHLFYSFEDFATQLKVYNRRDYNNFPMRPLGWITPSEVLKDYLWFGEPTVIQIF